MNTETKFERGEIWWVSVGNAPGSTKLIGRPALIITDVGTCENPFALSVAYLTSSPKNSPIIPCVQYSGNKTWVLCDQIATVEKEVLSRKIAKLSDHEMRKVEYGLRKALGLSENAKPVEQPDQASLIVERDTYKKLYEKALEMLVDKRFEKDQNEPVVEPEPPKKREKIDLNTCSIDDLMGLGFWYRQAENITKARPFSAVEELADVSEIPPWLYGSVKSQVYVSEVPTDDPDDGVELFDLNTVDVTTLCKRLGFKRDVAENIVAARPYKKLDDLRIVPGVTRLAFQLVENRLVVEPVPVVAEEPVKVEPEIEKLNLNTATAKEIKAGLGLCESLAYSITGYRNKNGPYKSLDELFNVKAFTANKMEQIKDKVCL